MMNAAMQQTALLAVQTCCAARDYCAEGAGSCGLRA